MHSPEPWKLEITRETGYLASNDDIAIITSSDGSTISSDWPYNEIAPGILDAERIVACVNACRGIPTECLETIANTVRSALDAGNAIYAELANCKLAVTECNSTPPAWRAKYRTEPTADVESRYNLPPGTLK